MKCSVFRIDNNQVFIENATLVTNADGSVSFQLADGTFAGQLPGQYAGRADGGNQQYQRATLEGNVVTFVPLDSYPPYVYTMGQGKVYPA